MELRKAMRQALRMAAIAALAGLAGCASTASAPGAQAKAADKYRLVLHVSENNPAEWQLALNNALAFRRNVGPEKSQVEIVAIGPGLNMLKLESKATAGIIAAMDQNIDVVACGETMKATHVKPDDLIGGVRVVPGGLIEIVEREREGWAYARP